MTITYFAKNMLPKFKVPCRKLCQEVLRDDSVAGD